MSRNFLVVDPAERPDVLRALASEVRVAMLKLLHTDGAMNVNDIAGKLKQPQSTVSSNMQVLVDAGLVRTETQKARKGNQKICHPLFDEVLVMFKEDITPMKSKAIEVAMPLGLYTSCEVSAPCGLCSSEGIIGLLDVPDTRHLGSEGGGLRQRLAFDPDVTTAARVLAALSGRAEVVDLAVEEPDVEEVVRRVYASRR